MGIRLFIFFISVFQLSFLSAQEGILKGKIMDAKAKEGLGGVSVYLDGKGAAISDTSGNYETKCSVGNHSIEYKFIGYRSEIHNVEIKENEKKMRKDMMEDAKEMLTIAGVKDVNASDSGYSPGMGIHEMGTARMGKDPKTSVLNSHNQVWDCLNVFVTDGAAMTSSACQNPSLTYMALTARAVDHAVSEMKKGNLK